MDAYRKIIHIDMDAFFAAVEQRDNPALRGLPVAVGGDGERGVISTASYEARRFGVHSALATAIARRRCPQLVLLQPRFDAYKAVNAQLAALFHEYTDLVEFLSIDEAFLDVTENKTGAELASDIAQDIRRRIRDELQLTASAGVSYCKFLAKIASEQRKPDGLYTIHPDRAERFISRLPIDKFWGVGPKTAERMRYIGVFNGGDLRKLTLPQLTSHFGKQGKMFYDFARGIDPRPVVTEHDTKSVGCERTFEKDLRTETGAIVELYHVTLELLERLHRHKDFQGRTLTLKVKYEDFSQITRSISQDQPFRTKQQILAKAKALLRKADHTKGIRLIGLSISNPASDTTEGHGGRWVQLSFNFNGQKPEEPRPTKARISPRKKLR